jgi:hypothetical protein
MTTFSLPDWDFGEHTNTKLRDIFKIQGRIDESNADSFIEYLIQEVDVDALVSMVLYWAPKARIEELARDHGFLDE